MPQHRVLVAAVLYADGFQQHRTSIIRYAGELLVGAADREGLVWVGTHATLPESDLLPAVRNVARVVNEWEREPHHTASLYIASPEPSLT